MAFAAEVIKISKNKMDMAISHDLGEKWQIGNKICVESKDGNRICGEVVKVKTAGAICKMKAPLEGVAPGDEIVAEEEGGLKSDPITDPLDAGSKQDNLEEVQKNEPKKSKGKRKLGFGLRGGLSLANFSTDNPSIAETDNRTALDVGVILDVPFGKSLFGFEPGIYYVQKGYQTSNTATGWDYLDLRLLFKARVVKGDFTPVFYLGPYAALLLKSESSSQLGVIDTKDSFNSFDFGIMGGLGIEFKISKGVDLGLSGFYGLGLTGIEKESTFSPKNKTIHFLLHVIFQV
jgi:hypothetical protein